MSKESDFLKQNLLLMRMWYSQQNDNKALEYYPELVDKTATDVETIGPADGNLPANAQVGFLVWEESTCCGATKPVHHGY